MPRGVYVRTDATRAALSAAKTGKTHPHSGHPGNRATRQTQEGAVEIYRKWYENYKAILKARRKANPELFKLRSRICKTNRAEAIREYQARYNQMYRLGHAEKLHEARRARRALIAGSAGSVTAKEWSSILEYFGHKCAYCLAGGKMTQDHIVPISKGGQHTTCNVVPSCGSCNSKKHDRTPIQWLARAA
jgi:5-methylcytosine-specific restriction endonuclease McrA